ncbi:putative secreted effector protein [Blumeria graminis f. sp. tritici 96224]|uniref:BgtE-1730 n=1 Tax=Blumeria graminis f. sp. tritici 96224 TaxID=1268274 RepID=A0A381L625_BLUGR|nr:putative secreted effector protein [Blumeria graminis f. sp. tritici 96224]
MAPIAALSRLFDSVNDCREFKCPTGTTFDAKQIVELRDHVLGNRGSDGVINLNDSGQPFLYYKFKRKTFNQTRYSYTIKVSIAEEWVMVYEERNGFINYCTLQQVPKPPSN